MKSIEELTRCTKETKSKTGNHSLCGFSPGQKMRGASSATLVAIAFLRIANGAPTGINTCSEANDGFCNACDGECVGPARDVKAFNESPHHSFGAIAPTGTMDDCCDCCNCADPSSCPEYTISHPNNLDHDYCTSVDGVPGMFYPNEEWCDSGSTLGSYRKKACEDEMIADFASRVVGTVVLGIVLGIAITTLTSLVTCCGKLLKFKMVIAVIGLLGSFLVQGLPFLGAQWATGPAIDKICKEVGVCTRVECDPASEKIWRDMVTGLGVLYAYTFAFGWACLILGWTSCGLALGIFCGCCKAKENVQVVPQATVVAAQPQQDGDGVYI
jgi:hypothetical protein